MLRIYHNFSNVTLGERLGETPQLLSVRFKGWKEQ